MLSRCLACARDFPTNADLEHMPVGRRVAFDAARGRLWVICAWCGHWSLVPLEIRWEAVEELEKRACDSAIVVSRTDEIALIRIGRTEAVRVGAARLREETWWRYGTALRGRRLRHSRIVNAGGALAAATSVTMLGAVALLLPEVTALRWSSMRQAPGRARRGGERAAESFERWFRFGRVAWHGEAKCVSCGHLLQRLEFSQRGTAFLEADGSVRMRCQRCRGQDGWHVIEGPAAEPLIRRLLAYENVAGASESQLEGALELIRSERIRDYGSVSLKHAPPLTLTALEIVHARAYERSLLQAEIQDLESRWRSEEELARIIDRELTPRPSPDPDT